MKGYIPSLNGLRAFSILIVLFSHIRLRSFEGLVIPFPLNFLSDGSFGVNVFFVISGFLITLLLLKEEAKTGTISLKGFYVRRTLRIFPAYYFLLLVYALMQVAGILNLSAGSWLSSVFYFKYLGESDWETGHFWSLSVEEHFYLFWPFVCLYAGKWRTRFALALILMVMVFRLNTYFKWINLSFLIAQESLFLRADALMIGCLFAIYYEQIKKFIERIKFRLLVPLIVLSISFLNSDLLTVLNQKHGLHLGALLIPLGIGTSNGLFSNLLIGALIIYSINTSGLWYGILNSRLMNFIGKLSYSLYLWQQLFFSQKIGWFSQFPVNLVLIFLTALGSYYLIEKPFLRLKERTVPVPQSF